MNHHWSKELAAAITVCDERGIIIEMNDRAIHQFAEEGGKSLLGTNLLNCHPEPARSQLKELMEQERINIYTIEKRGKKKLIYQTPWYQNGEYSGFVEISMALPVTVPHFIRKD